MRTRLLLADDHAIVRDGLRALLSSEQDIQLIAEVEDGLQAIEAVRDSRPDVVLMDVSMPGMNGIEATRRVTEEFPDVKVLCLSMHAEQRFVSEVLEAGAVGYVLKECSAQELMLAIRSVMAGNVYLCADVSRTVVEDYKSKLSETKSSEASSLSSREREVLQLIAEGHPTRYIAKRLGLSAKTVGSHREHLMKKLGIDNVAGLTKYAIRHGITTTKR